MFSGDCWQTLWGITNWYTVEVDEEGSGEGVTPKTNLQNVTKIIPGIHWTAHSNDTTNNKKKTYCNW